MEDHSRARVASGDSCRTLGLTEGRHSLRGQEGLHRTAARHIVQVAVLAGVPHDRHSRSARRREVVELSRRGRLDEAESEVRRSPGEVVHKEDMDYEKAALVSDHKVADLVVERRIVLGEAAGNCSDPVEEVVLLDNTVLAEVVLE